MRRQSIFFSLISFIVLILGSCTLSMEEWVMPEEERGVYEPYTVKTDVAEVTYQYNEGVKPITDNVMQYFVTVQSDTILYFTDNCPKEWLPEVGGYVQIGCTKPFPLGYNGRVLEKTRANGQIRLLTTKAAVAEIFKDLKIVAEGPLTTQIPEDYKPGNHVWDCDTSDYVIDFGPDVPEFDEVFEGVEEEDSSKFVSPIVPAATNYPVIEAVHKDAPKNRSLTPREEDYFIDYSLVKDQVPELYEIQMKKHFPRAFARMSRSDDDDEQPEDVEETDYWSLKLGINPVSIEFKKNDWGTSVSFPLEDFKDKGKLEKLCDKCSDDIKTLKLEPGGSLEYKSTNKKVFHVEYDKSEDFEKNVVIETESRSLTATMGFTAGGAVHFKDEGEGKINTKLKEYYKKKKNSNKKLSFSKYGLLDFDKYVIILPQLALYLKINIEFGLQLNLDMAGSVTYSLSTETVKGYQQKKGKKEKIQTYDRKDPSLSAEGCGTIGVGGYASIYIGLEIAKSAGSGGTITGGIGITANMTTDDNIPNSNYNDYATTNNCFKPYCTVGGNIKFYLAPAGYTLAEKVLTFPEKDFWEDVKWPFAPTLAVNGGVLDASIKEYQTKPHFTGSYKLTKYGFYPWCPFYEPRLRLYEYPFSSAFTATDGNLDFFGDYPIDELVPKEGNVFAKSTYHFDEYVSGLTSEDHSYVAVPCLYNSLNGRYLIYPKLARQVEVGDPKMGVLAVKQTKGRPLKLSERKEYGIHSNHVSEYYVYEVATVIKLTNGTKVRNVKLNVIVRNHDDGDVIRTNVLPFPRAYASGNYIFLTRFVSNRFPLDMDNGPLEFEVRPTFEDYAGKLQEYKATIPAIVLEEIEDQKVGYKGQVIDSKVK